MEYEECGAALSAPQPSVGPSLFGYSNDVSCVSSSPLCVREVDEKAPTFGYASIGAETVEETAMRKAGAMGVSVLPSERLTDFLLRVGYADLGNDVLSTLEALICLNLSGKTFWMEQAYLKIAAMQGCSPDTVRTKLTYQLKRKYDTVRAKIETLCGLSLDKHFAGNKLFVTALSHAYIKFCNKDMPLA